MSGIFSSPTECVILDKFFSVNHTMPSAFLKTTKCAILDRFLSVASLGCLPQNEAAWRPDYRM